MSKSIIRVIGKDNISADIEVDKGDGLIVTMFSVPVELVDDIDIGRWYTRTIEVLTDGVLVKFELLYNDNKP